MPSFPRSFARSSLHCTALARLCLAHVAQLVLLGFTWLRLAWVTRLYSAQLRSACVALLSLASWLAACILACCSHHWLPSLSLRRLASALARVARLASRAKCHWASLDLRRWLARVVPGLLRWRRWLSRWRSLQLSSLGTLLGLASLRSALRRWLALLACCSRCWLPLLGLRQRQLTSHRLACIALLMFF